MRYIQSHIECFRTALSLLSLDNHWKITALNFWNADLLSIFWIYVWHCCTIYLCCSMMLNVKLVFFSLCFKCKIRYFFSMLHRNCQWVSGPSVKLQENLRTKWKIVMEISLLVSLSIMTLFGYSCSPYNLCIIIIFAYFKNYRSSRITINFSPYGAFVSVDLFWPLFNATSILLSVCRVGRK